MKKTFRSYCIIWAIFVAVFNVIAFVSPGWKGIEKYTASFWIGYLLITVCFLGHLGCTAYVMFSKRSHAIYRLRLIKVSRTGLIWSFVVGGAGMLISPLPHWIGALVCAVVLALTMLALAKVNLAAEAITEVEDNVSQKTQFIKFLTVDADNLRQRAKSEGTKAACKKIYEAARYSDPMSNYGLESIETEISSKMGALSHLINQDNESETVRIAQEVVALIEARNRECKALK